MIAVLGDVRGRPTLLDDPTQVHEVDDALELVNATEVRDLRRVAGLDEHVESVRHQLGDGPAEGASAPEEAGLGLLSECGADHAGPGAAYRLRVRHGKVERL